MGEAPGPLFLQSATRSGKGRRFGGSAFSPGRRFTQRSPVKSSLLSTGVEHRDANTPTRLLIKGLAITFHRQGEHDRGKKHDRPEFASDVCKTDPFQHDSSRNAKKMRDR
jgi:hypothetical protein